jgi:DNA repair protein RAD7
MYFKEELRQYKLRKEGKAKEKLVLGNNHSRAVGSGYGSSSCKLSTDSKGKGKMVVEDSLSSSLSSSEDELDSEQVDSKEIQRDNSLSSLSSSENELDSEPVEAKEVQSNSGSVSASMEPLRRQAARERAIRLAPKFAFFKADKDEPSQDDEEEELEPGSDPQDWPGPFATAARIYEEREAKLRARESNSLKVNKSANKAIVWSPSKDKKNPVRARAAPSLTSLCINTLAEHSEGIESLGGIPEELKHKLLKILCQSRKMNTHLLNELLCDSPTELHLSECSWLSDDDFEKTFGKCKTDSLQVLLFLHFMQFLHDIHIVYTFW